MITESKYVVDVMTPNPVVVGPETVTRSAERLAEQRNVHDLLVIEGYRLAGVVCRCDLRRARASGRVRDYMRHTPITIDDQETAAAAEEIMNRRAVGCLPVVDWSGALRGIVTRRDLLEAGVIDEDGIPSCRGCGSTHGLSTTTIPMCSRCCGHGCEPSDVPADGEYLAAGGW